MNILPELINSYKQALCCIDNYKDDTLDLSSIEFLYPTSIAILSLFIKSNKPKRIIFHNEDVLQYFHVIMYGNVSNSKTYIPFIELSENQYNYDTKNNEVYNAIRAWSGNIYEPLYYIINELRSNVDDHARHTNAYVLAQYYPKRRFVEVAIIDDGIGIPNSLRNAHKFVNTINDSDLIIKAIEGYSSKPEEGRAFGLGSSLHIAVERMNGEALVASIKGMIYLNNDSREMLISDTGYIKGTLIGIRIPIRDNADVINVPAEADKRIDLNRYSKRRLYI